MAEKLRVIGAAVVLPLVAGSERYLYRGAEVEAKGFTPEGIKHAITVGLVEKFDGTDEPEDEKAAADKAAADKKAADEKAAADKAAADAAAKK